MRSGDAMACVLSGLKGKSNLFGLSNKLTASPFIFRIRWTSYELDHKIQLAILEWRIYFFFFLPLTTTYTRA